MSIFAISMLFIAAFAAGLLNAIAGGGTLITFPALIAAGVPPVMANATSAVSQWPGYVASSITLKNEIRGQPLLIKMSVYSVAGGIIGGWLVTVVSPSLFETLIPWLILLATVMFACSDSLTRWMGGRAVNASRHPHRLLISQLIVSIYGGFFGGGMGIMMLALYSVFTLDTLPRMNALKTWLSVLISGVAVMTFLIADLVNRPVALIMLAGTILGGISGARLSQSLPTIWLRRLVIVLGSLLTLFFLLKTYVGS